ncbi:hypothetical protein ACJX0J_025707 [Zea mays]
MENGGDFTFFLFTFLHRFIVPKLVGFLSKMGSQDTLCYIECYFNMLEMMHNKKTIIIASTHSKAIVQQQSKTFTENNVVNERDAELKRTSNRYKRPSHTLNGPVKHIKNIIDSKNISETRDSNLFSCALAATRAQSVEQLLDIITLDEINYKNNLHIYEVAHGQDGVVWQIDNKQG